FLAAGDVATTLPVRESIRAAMSWLWVNPSLCPELSMQRFAEVTAEILLRLWRTRSEMTIDPVRVTIGLVGWCPRQSRGRAFLLEPQVKDGKTVVAVNEVETSYGPLFFGSGSDAARRVLADEPSLSPPQVIRRVARLSLDPMVGGRVQYGRLV